MPANPPKICVICNRDCSAIPRLKDAQGRYACKECSDKRAAKIAAKPASRPVAKPAPAPAPAAEYDEELAAIQAATASAGTAPALIKCPSCATPMAAHESFCMHCGFNRVTGKAAPKLKKPKEAKESSGKPGVLGEFIQENPLAWGLAAALGAGLGGFGWVVLSLSTERHITLIGPVLGLLAGIAVLLVARSKAGLGSGLVAALVTVAVVFASNFIGTKKVLGIQVDRIVAGARVSPDEAQILYSFKTAREWERAGKLSWTDPDGPTKVDDVESVEELPTQLIEAADKAWAGQTDDQRERYRLEEEVKFKDAVRIYFDARADEIANNRMTALNIPSSRETLSGEPEEEQQTTRKVRVRRRGATAGVFSALFPILMPIIAGAVAYALGSGSVASFD